MQDQRKRDASQTDGLSEEHIDSAVLDCMLLGEAWPWSMDEIARELGDDTGESPRESWWRFLLSVLSVLGLLVLRRRESFAGAV